MKKSENIKTKIKRKLFKIMFSELANHLIEENKNQQAEIRNLKNRLLQSSYNNQRLQTQLNLRNNL